MEREFVILIADRNPHVREFLRREMTAEGYRVLLAKNGQEVIKWAYQQDPVDLVILDPDLPDADGSSILRKLHDRIPALPVVLHAFQSDDPQAALFAGKSTFVEKKGGSIEHLIRVVSRILERPDSREDLADKSKGFHETD